MEQVNTEKQLQRRKLREGVLTYTILTAATLIMVVGVYIFKFPNHFSFGGVSGLAIVLAAVIPLSVGTINFIINILLLAVGLIFLGKSFSIKTIYVSLLMSTALSFMEYVFPMSDPLTDQPMLELLFAISLPAFSSAILFNMGASSGGLEIIAMIVKKHTRFDNIGMPLFLVNLGVAVLACLIFNIETGLYSFTGLLVQSLVIDSVIENINLCKSFTVVCNRPQIICDYIHEHFGSSATVIRGEGSYEHKERYVILVALKRGQAVELRNFIKIHDPKAFLMINNSSEIIGRGFRRQN